MTFHFVRARSHVICCIDLGVEHWAVGVPNSRFSHGMYDEKHFFTEDVLSGFRRQVFVVFLKPCGQFSWFVGPETGLEIDGLFGGVTNLDWGRW